MDPIDAQITSTLRKGKHMNFEELLSKLSVSQNTLRLHLDAMAEKGEIVKEKRPSETRGRPSYLYSTASGPVRQSSTRLNRVSGVRAHIAREAS